MNNNFELFKQNANHCYTTIDDPVIILEAQSGQYYCFNETASKLWQWLEQPITSAQLTKELSKNLIKNRKLPNKKLKSG